MTTPHRTLREAAQMALDALLIGYHRGTHDAITALREALAAPEPEPVAWYYVEDPWGANEWHFITDSPESQECDPRDWTPLYAAPPAAPAVPLQGGMDNNELLAAWQKKLPGRTPEGQELSAFAVGTEVGFEHAQRLERMDWGRVHHVLAKHGKHPGRTDDHLADVIDKALSAAPQAAPADDHATPSGGQEAGPQEDRIEAAYWRFDARHKGYSQWKTAPMSERDAFKAEMRNALEAEKVRAEMRLVARGWRRPDAPAAPAPAAPVVPNGCEKIFTHKWLDPDCIEQGCKSLAAHVVPLTDEQIRSMWKSSEFRGNGGQVDWFCEGIRAAEVHHGITGASNG